MKFLHKKIVYFLVAAAFCVFAFSGCDAFTKYAVTLQTNDPEICSLVGGGDYYAGKQIKIECKKTGQQNKNFLGWYSEETLLSSQLVFTYTTPKQDVTLLAKWSNEITTLNFYSDKNNNYSNLNLLSPKTQEREQYAAVDVEPSANVGYVFVGWYKDAALTEPVSQNTTLNAVYIQNNANLFAKWEVGYYHITFTSEQDVNLTISPDKTDYNYGEEITISAPESVENLVFSGFYFDGVLKTAENPYTFSMPLKSLNIVAKYSSSSDFSYTENNGLLELSAYYGTDVDVYIPDKIDGKSVTKIGTDCFKNKSNISKIFVPQTITQIADEAFYNTSANIYFDYGFDVDLITPSVLKAENNVLVNVKYSNVKNSLIDNFYCIYDGRIADNLIDSRQEFVDMYSYIWLYGIYGKTTLKFNSYTPTDNSVSGTTTDKILAGIKNIFEEENKKIDFKSDLVGSYRYSLNTSGSSHSITLEFTKKDYSLASQTNTAVQTEIDSATKYTTHLNNTRNFAIFNSKKYMTVNNTEQLLMAVSAGFNPVCKNVQTNDVFAKAQSILSEIVTDKMSQTQKVLAIHDYVCLNNIYDTQLAQKANSETNVDKYRGFYLEGTLLDRLSVCDGIAKTVKLLCNIEGIECLKVIGTLSGTGHAWNKVKVDGNWYALDATNDSKIFSTVSFKYEILSHELFLVSDSELQTFGCVQSSAITYPAANNSLRTSYYNTYIIDTTSNYNLILNSQAEANALAAYVKNKQQTGSKISVEFIIYNSDSSKINLYNILCFGQSPINTKAYGTNAKLYIMLVG